VVLIVREPIETFEFVGLGGARTLDPATVSAMQEASHNEAIAVAEDGAALGPVRFRMLAAVDPTRSAALASG